MTTSTLTPPIVLARRARHRKPARRRHVIAKVLGSLALAAVVASIGAARADIQAPAFYGLTPGQLSHVATTLEAPAAQLDAFTATPAQEEAACAAVLHYHHVNAIDNGGVHVMWAERAWYHAWHVARYADPQLRAEIRYYLYTGLHWMAVYTDCGYGS